MAAGQTGRKDILKLLFFAWGRGAGTLSYSKIRNIVQASKSHALFHIVCGRGWNEVWPEGVWGGATGVEFGSGSDRVRVCRAVFQTLRREEKRVRRDKKLSAEYEWGSFMFNFGT